MIKADLMTQRTLDYVTKSIRDCLNQELERETGVECTTSSLKYIRAIVTQLLLSHKANEIISDYRDVRVSLDRDNEYMVMPTVFASNWVEMRFTIDDGKIGASLVEKELIQRIENKGW